jgi:hypothetical protein
MNLPFLESVTLSVVVILAGDELVMSGEAQTEI